MFWVDKSTVFCIFGKKNQQSNPMKTKSLLLCMGLILIGSINVSGQGCAGTANIYTFFYNNKTYEVIREKKTWADAALCAVELGGYLVEINDANEQAAVYDAIINGAMVSPTYTTVPDGGGIAYVWIGATDQATEGTWLWDGNNEGNGINFWIGEGTAGSGGGHVVGGAYANWGGASTGTYHEPDDYAGIQDGAAIGLSGWPSGSGSLGIASEWNDINMANALYFVIEKDNANGMNYRDSSDPVKFYPNPVKDLLTIKTFHTGYTIASATVCDLAGKELLNHKSLKNSLYTMNLSQLASGTYLVKVILSDRVEVNCRIVVL
jgi:hypothetical protein